MSNHTTTQGGIRLATIKQVPNLDGYQWLTESALRHLIFDSQERFNSSGKKISGNGLAEVGAIVRIGRKVLLDLDRFDVWQGNHRTQDAVPHKGP